MELPERIKHLRVSLNTKDCGHLLRESQFVFSYDRDDVNQATVSLLQPPTTMIYRDNALFPVIDQNLPEGYLLGQLRERFRKQALTPMHLLALMGDNAIGRLGFHRNEGDLGPPPGAALTKESLLKTAYSPRTFAALVDAYIGVGFGVSGMQPKVMIPDRSTVPIPSLIVKAGSDAYAGICANEFLCLSAAQRAGISTASASLSDDGQLLVLDRFDLEPDGTRLGFEDIAALMGLRVRDILSDRKYLGSYQAIAEVLRQIQLPAESLHQFFEQVAFSIMVRNGDGHLKNYGVLYGGSPRMPRLAPMFDVLTTSIYRYERISGGADLEDKTLALKLHRGDRTKAYPVTADLLRFARDVCGVTRPQEVLERLADSMSATLMEARHDERIPKDLLPQMAEAWGTGLQYALEAKRGVAEEEKATPKRRRKP